MCRDIAQPAAQSESGDDPPANGLGSSNMHAHAQHPNPEPDKHSIDRFCFQYLQMDPSPEYPAGELLKHAAVQDEIFDRLFAAHATRPPKTARLQLRALKELVNRIEDGMSNQESDEFAVSDNIMGRIGELMCLPQTSELEEAQQKCIASYRLSLLQPPPWVDILENRSLIAASGTTGLRTWEAALHLGQYLCLHRHLVQGKRVLELGAGTGYLSIVCAKHLGAAHVTASDGSEEVVDSLPDNFALNHVQWAYDSSAADAVLCPKLLKWGHALIGTEEAMWNRGQPIDVVIGADITYDQRVNSPLVATLRDLVDLFPDVTIIIAATQRNEKTLTVFRDSCVRNGLCLEESVLSPAQLQDRVPDRSLLTPFYSLSMPIHIYSISQGCKPASDSKE